ncbi:TPA: hypothetical protein ACH3X1_008200 [Trebouxia sp. C0004]
MQTALQPLHHRCGIALLPSRRSTCSQDSPRRVRGEEARQALQVVIRCNSFEQGKAGFTSRTLFGAALAAAVSMGTMASTESALAKTYPVKKTDPYEDLQNIIKSRSSGSSVSLFESFKQQAQEAAKIPAEILKAPTEAIQPAPEAPAIPLPNTKALPQPTSKAPAVDGGPSAGFVAGVGAVVLGAVAATSSGGGIKATTKVPKPNQIKAKIKGGTKQAGKQASKQAPKPTFSLPFLGGKAEQVGKTAKVKAGSAPQKAKKAASNGKSLLGTMSVKAKQAAPTKGLFGTASVKAKQSASTKGLFGTSPTRGKSTAPAKGGGSLGTRSTRPNSGGTTKVQVSPPDQSVAAAKKAVTSGGKSLVDEDTGTIVGALGIVGLAVAVGAWAIVSVTGSVGGSGGSVKAPAEVKQLLDRVPEPLPVVRKAQQAATQVASKAQEAVPQSAPSLKTTAPPRPPSISLSSLASPRDTLPPVAQTPQTPSGPDLVPELMQKPKTGAPLAPPPSDATKPKIPSGPDLRVPGLPGVDAPSLGAAPQLASTGPPPSPVKAADKASKKAMEAVPQMAQAPKAVDSATNKVAEIAPKVAQAAPKQEPADPSTSVGSPIVLLALAGVAVFGVLFAKQAQPQADTKESGAVAKSPTASSNGAPAAKGQAPQSAGEAAANAKERAKEAREWIDNWKSKQ